MAYQIEYAYTCHIGKLRANNEDNFWCCGDTLPADNKGTEKIQTGIISGDRIPAMAVFDGMGGESRGEMAAFLASEEFGRYYDENRRDIKKEPDAFIEGICRNMNDAVCRYGKENRINSMGTTMAMLVFAPDALYACNLGDSRIYQSDEGEFRQISTDHVLGGGRFGKAPLTQYLGIADEQIMLEPSVAEIEYKAGNKYLLCSDGVTDMLSDEEMADILTREGSPQEMVELLLERALSKGGRDNVTIILCEVNRLESKDRMRMWAEHLRKKIRVM